MATHYNKNSDVFFNGKINLPVVELNVRSLVHDYSIKLFNVYSDCVENTPLGQEVLAKLEADSRVSLLKGEMISRGSGASTFDVKNLAKWFLWHANNVGWDFAFTDLELFLNSDELMVINSLWITGIEVDEEIEIQDGVYIRPAQTMPDSREKEFFLQQEFLSTGLRTLKPACVLTKNVKIPRIHSKDPLVPTLPLKHDFWTSRTRFYEIASLLNVLPNVTCLPCYETAHVDASTPMGPFGGTGGGFPIYDIQAKHTVKLAKESIGVLNELLNKFCLLDDQSQMRIKTAISRLSQAKRRIQLEDQMLDLGIAMEMLLLDNKTDQLAFSFRLRGSWLLSTTKQERLENYNVLKEIYNRRSEVAHTGILCDGKPAKIAKVRDSIPKYQKIAEDICRKIILNGFPDWESLILDIN